MSKYKVWFNFNGQLKWVDLPENRRILDVATGFWVDVDFNWTVASQVRYWIPPSQILYVEKEEK